MTLKKLRKPLVSTKEHCLPFFLTTIPLGPTQMRRRRWPPSHRLRPPCAARDSLPAVHATVYCLPRASCRRQYAPRRRPRAPVVPMFPSQNVLETTIERPGYLPRCWPDSLPALPCPLSRPCPVRLFPAAMERSTATPGPHTAPPKIRRRPSVPSSPFSDQLRRRT
jgi:hypothetical protein